MERKVNPNLCGAGERIIDMQDKEIEISEIAERIALDNYGREFYLLSAGARQSVYAKAEREWNDRQAMKADGLEER
jgi:hypothetical protein